MRGAVVRRITTVQHTYSYNIACTNHKRFGERIPSARLRASNVVFSSNYMKAFVEVSLITNKVGQTNQTPLS